MFSALLSVTEVLGRLSRNPEQQIQKYGGLSLMKLLQAIYG